MYRNQWMLAILKLVYLNFKSSFPSRLRFYPWQMLPRWAGLVLPANDWTSANFSRIWWSLGITAGWMWLMQQMNPILKINGVYNKMLGGRAKIPQFSQRTTATICSTGEYSSYSYWMTILTQPQTRNSYRIDRRASQQGSRTGVAVLVPDFDKFVNERNRRQLLKCKGTINLSTFNVGTLKSVKKMS